MAASKKTRKSELSKRTIWIVGVALGLALCSFALWWVVFKHNAYSPDKSAVRAEAQKVLSSVSLKGAEVYSSFEDEGCNLNTVGLRTSTDCSFKGYKYYKAAGSLSQDLKAADGEIIASGWRRTFTPQNPTELDQLFSDTFTQAISYRNSNWERGMSVSLGYYKNAATKSDDKLQRLIQDGKIQAPAEGEYIYGIWVGASYWGCTNDSLFKICPLPPSPNNN